MAGTYKTAITAGYKLIRRLTDKAVIGLVDEDDKESYFGPKSAELKVSRNSDVDDSGCDPLACVSATDITYTLLANITDALIIEQKGAGKATVSGDASVQMIGAGSSAITSLQTTGVGSLILIRPIDLTASPKKYLVLKGGA